MCMCIETETIDLCSLRRLLFFSDSMFYLQFIHVVLCYLCAPGSQLPYFSVVSFL